jgi:hypothetical protein
MLTNHRHHNLSAIHVCSPKRQFPQSHIFGKFTGPAGSKGVNLVKTPFSRHIVPTQVGLLPAQEAASTST